MSVCPNPMLLELFLDDNKTRIAVNPLHVGLVFEQLQGLDGKPHAIIDYMGKTFCLALTFDQFNNAVREFIEEGELDDPLPGEGRVQ